MPIWSHFKDKLEPKTAEGLVSSACHMNTSQQFGICALDSVVVWI